MFKRKRLKIIICPDSFKGSISSPDGCRQISAGLRRGLLDLGINDAEILCFPIADGGEGTLDALTLKKDRYGITVNDPLFRPIYAEWGETSLGGERTAIIEMARASGLTLLCEEERDPRATTTYGVGELMLSAINEGVKDILLTVGGSATNDGGCGMAACLGARFYDDIGREFIPTGGTLWKIARADLSGFKRTLEGVSVTIACDVVNPLVGDRGAARVYGAQKGASAEDIIHLEAGMMHYASVISKLCGYDITSIPGFGAAGGISVLLSTFAGAKICSGISTVLDRCGIRDALEGTDLCITGEGRLDLQSLEGKAIQGVSSLAKESSVPVWIVCGCASASVCDESGKPHASLAELGVIGVTALAPDGDKSAVRNAIDHAGELLFLAGRELAEKITKEI